MWLEMNFNTPSNKRLNTEMDFSPEGQLTDQEKKMSRSEYDQEIKMFQNENMSLFAELLDRKFTEYLTPVKQEIEKLKVVVQESESNSKAICDQLRQDCKLVKEENKALIKKVERLEFFQRRNNMKVFGLKEEKNEDLDEKLVAILNSCSAPAVSFNNRTFERVHRLGGFSDNTTRPVIARFAHFKDKLLAYKAAGQLRSKQIYLSDDYPGKMADNRQKLSPVYNALRNMKTTMESSDVKTLARKQDTILLNGRSYDIDTLEHLPDALSLKSIFTPSKSGITAFFSKHSPLSNFYDCQFEVNGMTFDNMERFLSIRKAKLFKDIKAVEDIKKQTDPAAIKTIAKKVSGFKAFEWEANIMGILMKVSVQSLSKTKSWQDFYWTWGQTLLLKQTNMTHCVL